MTRSIRSIVSSYLFLEVKINSGEFYKGQLKSFNNDFIEINSKVKEPKNE